MAVDKPNFKVLLRIALPMVVSQASETVMMFVDRLFLSQLGKVHIAAAMSGGLSSFVFLSLFLGTVGYVNALSAQFYGADDESGCIRSVTQGFRLSLFFYPLALLLIPAVKRFFILAGHSPEQIGLEFTYFRLLMAGGLFGLFRTVLAGFFLGIGKTRTVMLANLTGMVINIPANYVLIFGKAGFPALGMTGAALGTLAGSLVTTGLLLAAFLRHRIYREHHSRELWQWDRIITGKLLRYGLPAGVEQFLNIFAFNLFVQMMHSYSADVAAAVTITFSYDMVAFIPMLGLGFATTSLAGQQMGAGRPDGAEQVARLSLKVGLAYSFSMAMLFVFGAGTLVRAFSGGLTAEDGEVIDLAKTLLRLASLYTMADVLQLVMAGTLRGAGDTKYIMYISVALHWTMALVTFLMIKVFVASPVSVWLVFIGLVVAMGAAMTLRFKFGPWRSLRIIE